MQCHCKKPQCVDCPGTTGTGQIAKGGHRRGKQLYFCRACGHQFTIGDYRQQNVGRPSKHRCQWGTYRVNENTVDWQCPKKGYARIDTEAFLCNEHYWAFKAPNDRAQQLYARTQEMLRQDKMTQQLTDGTITKKPIKSYRGDRSLYCKQCGEDVPVAYHCTGQSENRTLERINWDFVLGKCGHTVAENSS